jgi:Pectate lyase superfamily protein
MYFARWRAYVKAVIATLCLTTTTLVCGQQTFNGTTTFNGNVFMKGPAPWFDVKAFGAVGDGVADDTLKIQQAINAAGANGGGTVFFPPGKYKVTTSLKDRNVNPVNAAKPANTQWINLELRGAGNSGWGFGPPTPVSPPGTSSIITNQAIVIFDFGGTGSGNPFGPRISSLGFQDSSSAQNVALGAIKITNEYHIQMQDIACADFTVGFCISLEAPGASDVVQYGSFIEIKSRNTKFGFRAIGQAVQFMLIGGHFSAPPFPGGANGVLAGSVGIDIQGPSIAASDTLMILNPSLESFETGIKLRNVSGMRISARIENTNTSYHLGTAISIDGSPVTATGPSRANMIIGTAIGGSSVGIQLGAGAKYTQVFGNSIIDTLTQIISGSGADGTLIIGGEIQGGSSGTGGARWTSGVGLPYTGAACSNGSLYTRTDATGTTTPVLYACQGGAWAAK